MGLGSNKADPTLQEILNQLRDLAQRLDRLEDMLRWAAIGGAPQETHMTVTDYIRATWPGATRREEERRRSRIRRLIRGGKIEMLGDGAISVADANTTLHVRRVR
jgi:hypothetical protein